MSYSLDRVYRVWNDDTGERVEISIDTTTSSELIKIASMDCDNEEVFYAYLTRAQADLISIALSELSKEKLND